MTELYDLTLTECANLLRRGEVSSRELTKAFIRRINHLDTHIHAYLERTCDEALFRANRADFFFSQRDNQPARQTTTLLGLPIAIKDVLALSGVRTTCGSKILDNFIPPYTATAVQRLLEEGVIILGKTNTDEFAMGSSTENSAYGTTHNPWNLDCVPGGSSGGSAAAVASGMALAALGTDTGGSIRQPAAFCGITGLKPTYGRVSRYGLIAYGSSLDCPGPLARTAADVALLFSAIAGHDPLDSTSLQTPVPEIRLTNETDLKGYRIGIPDEYFIEGIQPDVENAIRAAIVTLGEMGAQIIPIRLPHTRYALPVYYLIAPAEASANLARFDSVRFGHHHVMDTYIDQFKVSRGEGFGAEVKRRIMLGTYALSAGYYDAYYGQAQKVRTLIKRDFELAFESVDAIAAPVAPTTAFRIGQHGDDPLAMYLEDIFTLPANLAGIPGIAFPVGQDQNHLPVGMQLMGRPFEEPVLLQLVHSYQQATAWHTLRPDLTTLAG
jgi:aspartyl-tRNA(Asn)/glutamyl-tRNA(Gln) amidotransferase subunit A